MNLFYEDYPDSIEVNGEEIKVITDFREVIRFMDMLADDKLTPYEKIQFTLQYFNPAPDDLLSAEYAYCDFITMVALNTEKCDSGGNKPEVFGFAIDYPFIFSGFLSEYGINLRTIPYLHWWEFMNLFNGMSDRTEIKQRIMYRSIDVGTIKDTEERKRIRKIQQAIALPQRKPSDCDIANAFM